MTDLDIFKDFVANQEAASLFKRWSRDNPGEYSKWKAYRDAILAGQNPTAPIMATDEGKAIIDAAKEAAPEVTPAPPAPPVTTNPWPTAVGYHYLETFSGSNDGINGQTGASLGMKWFDNANFWKIDLPSSGSETWSTDHKRVTTDYGYGIKMICNGESLADVNANGRGAGAQANLYPKTIGYAYAGHTHSDSDNTPGTDMETWYRARIMYPSADDHTMPGLNHLSSIEWHDQLYDTSLLSPAGGPSSSRGRKYSQGAADQKTSFGQTYSTIEGTDPVMCFYVVGGDTSGDWTTQVVSATLREGVPFGIHGITSVHPLLTPSVGKPGNPLLYDHWYDVIYDIKWAKLGHMKTWVDGVLVLDIDHPTVWTHPDGSHGYFGFGLYNYAGWASYSRATIFDAVVWGPTAESVGFTVPV